VLLGIIPGAGGTQRLPRLCGVPLALRMCTDGKPLPAPQAMAAGILDHIVEGDLVAGAIGFASEKAAGRQRRKTREIGISPEAARAGLAACEAARTSLAVTARGTRAPFAAVEAIAAALTLPFDEGSIRERELFAECVVSTESRALRHLFFAEREASKIAGLPPGTPVRDIRSAAIVGAGTMGSGIAMTYASAGIPVLLKDVDAATLDRALATIRRNYDSAVSKGRSSAQARDRAIACIHPTTSFDGFDGVDIAVEAVFEDLALKIATFAELGRVTRPDCILATNTSTLDVDAMARASGRPALVVGHHFFSPANIMKLLEIVRGRDTEPTVLATSVHLGKRLGKVPVVVGNCFGFVANRMLAYYLREAWLLLEEGASVEQIDRAMVDFGLPVGPFGMQDIAGLDVGARIRRHLAATGQQRADGPQSAIPDRLYEMGRYGQKTGAGFYRYEPGSRERIPDPLIERLAEEEARKRGVARAPVADDEIVARITTALANEGARVLDEKIAQRAGDIDVIYCDGFGFPRYRGGPMFYAQTTGLAELLDRVNRYRGRFGDYWQPAPLLERLVAERRGFYES
jgi:3-hydroxyacyl-CoA dehydrogenase